MSDDRIVVIDGGMRRHAALIAACAASIAIAGPAVHIPHPSERRGRDEPDYAGMHRRAREKRERRQREAEMTERLLRQRIASGKDDRDDKYLHAAARRRREAERASLSPSTVEAGD
jgi:hypothetical protein